MSIKLIISDFDGCLIDCKEVHFEALNKALEHVDVKFVISKEDHINKYDGLSTKKKLQLLVNEKNLPEDRLDEINNLKQKYTIELLNDFHITSDNVKQSVLKIKQNGFKFCVASNAIRKTVEVGLKRLGILQYVDKIYSNEDVVYQKPHPSIYIKCMNDFNVRPDETVIIEDSKHGRESAILSKSNLFEVDNSSGFVFDALNNYILSLSKENKIKWYAKNTLNVLIPMAGAGSRFVKAGYIKPKPLIDVNGKSMIERVVENLNIDCIYTFIVQKEHYNKYYLDVLLNLISKNCNIITVDGLTEGAACTTLLAKDIINNDKHLLIANSDQLVDWDSCDFMYSMIYNNVDGGILTFKDHEYSTKWSYAKLDKNNHVIEVAEKKVIGDDATVGIYYWNKGSDYVKYAEQMINKNIRVNNEFYVCPVYNEAINDGKNIKIYNINKMYGIGTPEDLEKYLNG